MSAGSVAPSLASLARPFVPVPHHEEIGGVAGFIEAVKPILPIPLLAAILPVVWLFFRRTWRELDEDAQKHRGEILAAGKVDHRPFIALVLVALILAMQEYYGTRPYFDQTLYPWLLRHDPDDKLKLLKYDELWGFVWWAGTRIGGYVLPFVVWKGFFRRDSLKDFGLRTAGFLDHVWIYGLFLLVVVPPLLIVSRSPDFGSYYPFYKQSHRSWFDFLAWEAMYFAQFFALEMFFRGFFVGVLRKSFGSGAIFAMAVPYCMIHFGKPYLEVCGAIVAGIALGSLSMKTKSIYQGFMVHITVAVMMDWLALRHRHCTPFVFWAPDVSVGCAVDAAARDEAAWHVERVVIPIFVVVAGAVAYLAWRRRQASLALPNAPPRE